MRRATANLLPVGVLVAFLLVCFRDLVAHPADLLVDGERATIDAALQPDARAIGNDLTRLFLPHHWRIAEQVAQGRLPSAWDPYGFGGRPRVGNPQAGLFYPPVWLVWLAWTPATLGWLTFVHLVLGGIGAFALARSERVSRTGATIASLAFAGSPYVLAQVFEGHYPHVWSASWYPWAFLAAGRLREGEILRALWLAPILALSALAGHMQEAYYLVLALGVWVFFEQLSGACQWVWGRCQSWVAGCEASIRLRRLGLLAAAEWQVDAFCDQVAAIDAELLASRARLRRQVLLGVALLVLTVGLAAVELLPDASASWWMLRPKPDSFSEAGRYHIGALNLLQLLCPAALGGPTDYVGYESYWETLLSLGWAPLVLVVVAIPFSTARRPVRQWGGLLLLTVLFAVGWRGGLFVILRQLVPGMSHFRAPARALYLTALAAAILAGLGADALRVASVRNRAWLHYRRIVCGLIVLLGIAAVIAWSMKWRGNPYDLVAEGTPPVIQAEPRHDGDLRRWLTGSVLVATAPAFWVAIAGTTILLFALVRRPTWANRAMLAYAALVFAELGWNGSQLLKTARAEVFFGDDPVAAAIHRAEPTKQFRIRARDAFYADLRAQRAGLEKININDAFQIQHSADLYEELYAIFRPIRPSWAQQSMSAAVDWHSAEVQQAVLDRMGVEFLVSDRPWPSARLPAVASGAWRGSNYLVYRNASALPRCYVVPRAVVSAGDDISRAIGSTSVSPREAVVTSADPLPAGGERQPFRPADYDGADPDRVIVTVRTERPGLLVIADAWMPGWTAEVDGERAQVLRGDHALRVVALHRAGMHRVVLRYRPPLFKLGLAISAFSAVIWMGVVIFVTVHRRQSEAIYPFLVPRDRSSEERVRGRVPIGSSGRGG
jgi:hypothetical protein